MRSSSTSPTVYVFKLHFSTSDHDVHGGRVEDGSAVVLYQHVLYIIVPTISLALVMIPLRYRMFTPRSVQRYVASTKTYRDISQ